MDRRGRVGRGREISEAPGGRGGEDDRLVVGASRGRRGRKRNGDQERLILNHRVIRRKASGRGYWSLDVRDEMGRRRRSKWMRSPFLTRLSSPSQMRLMLIRSRKEADWVPSYRTYYQPSHRVLTPREKFVTTPCDEADEGVGGKWRCPGYREMR
jgi:hypothetical protein